jgi:hypothetical protein
VWQKADFYRLLLWQKTDKMDNYSIVTISQELDHQNS